MLMKLQKADVFKKWHVKNKSNQGKMLTEMRAWSLTQYSNEKEQNGSMQMAGKKKIDGGESDGVKRERLKGKVKKLEKTLEEV